MAQAIFRCVLTKAVFTASSIYVSDIQPALTQRLSAEYDIQIAKDNIELVGKVDAIILAVKPRYCESVLQEIKGEVGEKPIFSIVSGWTIDMLQSCLQAGVHVLRVMPNTPAMVGEGMTLLGASHTLSSEEFDFSQAFFATIGKVMVLEDALFNIATCISGCGPAFMFQIIEALADAGVMHGLPRVTAYQLASQMMMGAGKMAKESGEHPAKLKDAVCSPGGTTIMGIYEMEKAGVRAAMMNAVTEALVKTEAISN